MISQLARQQFYTIFAVVLRPIFHNFHLPEKSKRQFILTLQIGFVQCYSVVQMQSYIMLLFLEELVGRLKLALQPMPLPCEF